MWHTNSKGIIPKTLHTGMKNYVVDLLNKGWITKSKSNYSFLIDGALCFFWNYRLWNLKTVPDYHPIPRILNVSDSLFGVLSFEPEKGISSDLFRQGKSNTYCIHHSMGITRMGESIIWFDWCTSRILVLYGELFNLYLGWVCISYLDGVTVFSFIFISHLIFNICVLPSVNWKRRVQQLIPKNASFSRKR